MFRRRFAGRAAALATVVGCFCAPFYCAEAADPSHSREIRELVDKRVNADGPGLSVLVSRKGVPVYMHGFGLADMDKKTPITPGSLFDLASVSKHITALAILKLAEAGKVRLDAPVSDYLRSYKVPVKGRAVTLNDLLHHVSGLVDYIDADWEEGDKVFATMTPTTLVHWLNRTKPRRAPGRKFEYNNSGYVLLAAVVEAVTHETFANYIKRELLEPAGVEEAFVLDGKTLPPRAVVTGYVTDKDGTVSKSSDPSVITGDGNVFMSAHALAHWEAALYQHKLLPTEGQKRLFENGRLDNGEPIEDENGNGYGCGWFLASDRNLAWHSGSWSGTATYVARDMDADIMVAVLSNDENAEVEELGDEILALFAK